MSKTYYIDWEAFVLYQDGNQEAEGLGPPIEVDEEAIEQHIKDGKISEEECKKLIDRLLEQDIFPMTHEDLLWEDEFGHGEAGVKDAGMNILKIKTEDGDVIYESEVGYL